MSMLATESPNSYGLVCCSSTAPSPTIGPWCRPVRGGFEIAEDPFQQLALEQPIGLGRQLIALGPALQALLLGHVAQQILDLLLQLVQLFDVARLGELGQLFQVDDADLRRLARPLPAA